MPHVVYALETDGGVYIGVTCRRLRERLAEHRCRRGFDGVMRPLATFENRDEALALERKLRPNYFMGLNRGKGGRCGMTPSRKGKIVPVRIVGVEYSALLDAANALGLKPTVVHYRLNSTSEKFAEWTYATQVRGRRSGKTMGGRHP